MEIDGVLFAPRMQDCFYKKFLGGNYITLHYRMFEGKGALRLHPLGTLSKPHFLQAAMRVIAITISVGTLNASKTAVPLRNFLKSKTTISIV